MPVWESINQWIMAHSHIVVIAMGAALLIFMIISLVALSMAVTLKKRYRKLMMGRDELNLEELLNRHGVLIEEGLHRQQQAEMQLKEVAEKLQLTVAGMGLVRYNAFRETGSDLSFSLALLDRNLDGVVLTSLFGREESRCYGKTIERGKSSYFLSEEEIQALEAARRRLKDQRR